MLPAARPTQQANPQVSILCPILEPRQVPALTVTFPERSGRSVRFVGGAGPAGGQVPAEGARGVRLASATTVVVLGALAFTLTVLYVPLAYPARDFSDGWQVLLGFLAFALPGVVVAGASRAIPSAGS